MSSPINYPTFLELVEKYLPSRLSSTQINSLKTLSFDTYHQIISDLDSSITLYNSFPSSLVGSNYSVDLFKNTTHLKSLLEELPLFSTVLSHLSASPKDLDTALAEMRDSTYFHYIYLIDNPKYLLANLMTLVYRCHLLSSRPALREGNAQVSSTLEEMSALRFLLGEDSLHFQSVRHWILDWEGEGFREDLANKISLLPQ